MRTPVRPTAVPTVEGPTVTFLAAPPAEAVPVAIDWPALPDVWPTLPGPGHPAFPGLLAAVLLGFAALGFRGDRRDPKLRHAAIDDRDGRARFP